jgi:hypothetical protein
LFLDKDAGGDARRSLFFDMVPRVAKVLLLGVLLACGDCRPAAPEPKDPWEARGQTVDESDLRILERADTILAGEALWNRADNRECMPDARTWSLFCALHQASLEVMGRYEHRKVALQEVRFAIEEITHGRAFEHRLMGFNNLPETTFGDVKAVLRVATERVRGRLATQTP